MDRSLLSARSALGRRIDGVREVKARKRRALVDSGRTLAIEPHPASIQDRDGSGPLLRASHSLSVSVH